MYPGRFRDCALANPAGYECTWITDDEATLTLLGIQRIGRLRIIISSVTAGFRSCRTGSTVAAYRS